MLYVLTLCVIVVWMVAVLRKKRLSWHAIVTAYMIGEATVDFFEGLFNVILGLYKFPTRLSPDPYMANEFSVIFADFLILPFTFVIFTYYASRTKRPWLLSLAFAATFISLEWVYLKLGYMKYVNWSLLVSAAFYVFGFRYAAHIASRIVDYNPPIPYRVRLICISHAVLMWFSAMFALPLLRMYQFKPGLLLDYVADCRVAELLIGDFLSVLIVIFIPMLPRKVKPAAFAVIAAIGMSIALVFYNKGWLVYFHRNHFLMATLRYILPLSLILLYDRWESDYEKARIAARASP